MKTTTVRELRNHYSRVLKWVSLGEEVEVTRRGKVVARVVPASTAKKSAVDWSQSAALTRQPWSKTLTAKESSAILAESQGS
ncbi:MAG: type II toxin-antitoxin system prevent-host-death family antitoxin [Verrucomicrobia bacterium]|nr:type II toxin-antitoxin system prevent-host-death family antitoxin [Verrucomicrobiota bacterium]